MKWSDIYQQWNTLGIMNSSVRGYCVNKNDPQVPFVCDD